MCCTKSQIYFFSYIFYLKTNPVVIFDFVSSTFTAYLHVLPFLCWPRITDYVSQPLWNVRSNNFCRNGNSNWTVYLQIFYFKKQFQHYITIQFQEVDTGTNKIIFRNVSASLIAITVNNQQTQYNLTHQEIENLRSFFFWLNWKILIYLILCRRLNG